MKILRDDEADMQKRLKFEENKRGFMKMSRSKQRQNAETDDSRFKLSTKMRAAVAANIYQS